MTKIVDWLERFWKLPENRQFLSACFVVIAVLFGLYITETRSRKADNDAWQGKYNALSDTVAAIERRQGIERYKMQRECDSIAYARRDLEYQKLEARFEAREQALHDIRQNMTKAIHTQEKTIRALKNAAK